MVAVRHARGFGRVAALALCCLLAADEDASARRSHRLKAKPAPAPASEFTGKPNPPGPIRFPDTRFEPVAFSDIDGWAADDHAAAYGAFLASCRAAPRPRAIRARFIRRWSRSAARRAPPER